MQSLAESFSCFQFRAADLLVALPAGSVSMVHETREYAPQAGEPQAELPHICAILDLPTQPAPLRILELADRRGESVLLRVDGPVGVRRVPVAAVVHGSARQGGPFAQGVIEQAEQLVFLLDPEKIIAAARRLVRQGESAAQEAAMETNES